MKPTVLANFEKVGISSFATLFGQTLGKISFCEKVSLESKKNQNDQYSFHTCQGCDMMEKCKSFTRVGEIGFSVPVKRSAPGALESILGSTLAATRTRSLRASWRNSIFRSGQMECSWCTQIDFQLNFLATKILDCGTTGRTCSVLRFLKILEK